MKLNGSRAYSRPESIPKMPTGLVELMEGLTKDILKNNPQDVYEYCANHMQTLLEIRDGPSRKKVLSLEDKIKMAQEKVKRRAEIRWQKYQMEFIKVKSEQVENNLLKKENSIDSSSMAADDIKVSKAVHHENDLTNSDEIEIFCGSGVNDTVLNENTTEVEPLKKGINEQQNSGIVKDLYPITNDKPQEINLIDKMVEEKISSNNTPIAIITEPFLQTEQKSLSTLVENVNVQLQMSAQHDLPGNESRGNITHSTTDINVSMDINIPKEISQDCVEEINTSDININNSIEKIMPIGDNNSNEPDTIDFDKYNIKIEKANEGGTNFIIADNNLNKFISESINLKKTIEDEFPSIQFKNLSSNINTKESISKDLTVNEIKDDLSNKSNGNGKKGNTSDVTNDYTGDFTNIKTMIDVENNIFEDKAFSEKNAIILLEKFNTYSEENKLKENLEVINNIKNIALSDKTRNQLDNTLIEDNINGEYPIDKVINAIEDDQIEIALNNCPDLQVDLEKFSNASAESEMRTPKKMNNKDDCVVIKNDVTIKQLSHTVNNEQLESDNKTNYFHNENDADFEDSSHINSQTTTDSVKTEFKLLNQNIKERTIDKQYFDVDINVKSLEGDENNIINVNEERDSFDDSITEEINSTIEGVVTDYTDETILNDSANTMDLETAAVTIQKVFRSFLFKTRVSTLDDSTNEDNNLSYEHNEDKKDPHEFLPATINKDRRTLGLSRMDTVLQTVNEEKSLSLSTDDSSTLSSAATVIQAHVRGYLVRNKLNSGKTASSTNSLLNFDAPSVSSYEEDADQNKNKTILNIHIIPEGNNFLSRDESIITSMDLSLDGSPPSSVNLHPCYDKTNERRKQLKREDAVQSISPPSNNSGKLSEDVESVKEIAVNGEAEVCVAMLEHQTATATFINGTSQDTEKSSIGSTPTNSITIGTVIEDQTSNTIRLNSPEPLDASDIKTMSLIKQSSDEMDVVTPFKENITQKSLESPPKLLHSGEFHDTLIPTKVSRKSTSAVSGE